MPLSFASCLRPALLAVACTLAGCGHALPDLPDFDSATWKADPYGCRNQRAALVPILEKHRADLFEARVNDITNLLGHPDEEELGEQSDKVYIYYVTPGLHCQPGHPRSALPRVMLRSGATGTVTELIIPVMPTKK